MIQDASDIPDNSILKSDICVVGAGAAGISMALSLMESGLSVLLLESGGVSEEAETQTLYEGEVADEALHSPPASYRQRRFGGSTTIWGGRCMPMDPIDFEQRDYMPHSGWPISFEDLRPYYERANQLCEAGNFVYSSTESYPARARAMLSGFHSSNFSTEQIERFSCPTNFAVRYGDRLAAADDVRLILHANVTNISLAEDGKSVRLVQVKTLSGKAFQVQAQHLVLCVGGLEVARLLLASRDHSNQGIGNEHDVVGRYYMCHLAGVIGTLAAADPASVWHGYDVSDEGVYCRQRIALLPSQQRAQGLANFVARLHFPRMTDPRHRIGILSAFCLGKFLIPYEYRKRLIDGGKTTLRVWLAHCRNVLLDLPYTVGFVWHLIRDRFLAERKFPSIIIRSKGGRFSLDFHAEQEPNPESRISLGQGVDALGMPRLRVDWRYTQGDVDKLRRSLALFAHDVAESGFGTFQYEPEMVETEMLRYGAYGGHHIGTTRMGDDPRSSVVDAQCRVHAVSNLHIASASVFPTSSQANPTLTLIAIALRLAQHLKKQTVPSSDFNTSEIRPQEART